MEWRIFFPLLKNDVPSIDIIAHLFKQKARYSPELRTDEYIVMPSVQYGLKLRNTTSHRPLLELKVRSKIESNGTEHWSKVIAGPSHGLKNIDLTSNGSKYAKQCLEEFRKLPSIVICTTKKSRQQFPYMSCLCEQTDMTISFNGSSSPSFTYRSICFEGGNPDTVLKSKAFQEYMDSVRQYCKDNGIEDSLQQIGYPEFVYKLYQSVSQSPTQ